MKIRVLGCGTSSGVPVPGCPCPVCTSKHPRNSRLRCSIYIEVPKQESGLEKSVHLLVDTATDLRQQLLLFGVKKLDAVLFTHTHADHTNGIDDLRCFNFILRKTIPIYASEEAEKELERRFYYAFHPDPNYEGGAPPQLSLHRIKPYKRESIAGIDVMPLLLNHGRSEVLGFRIGNFAYLTDCSRIPEETKEQLEGVTHLLLDALRDRPHKTHFTIAEATREAAEIAPEITYLTHLSHEVDYEKVNARLKSEAPVPVELAYDGLLIELPYHPA